MAAFIPSRRDPAVNAAALEKVRADKEREAGDGFDGSWVAHPDLVSVCREMFDAVLGDRPNQLHRRRADVVVTARDLLDVAATPGAITEQGVRGNVSVALRYLEAWLGGFGAAAIDNLMEDTATAEICRSQLWQWAHNEVRLDDGTPITSDLVRRIVEEEYAELRRSAADDESAVARLNDARTLFERVALADDFVDFLTLPAYEEFVS
jgi:malate synthase